MKRRLLLATSIMVLALIIMSGCSSEGVAISEYTEEVIETTDTITELMTTLSTLTREAGEDLSVMNSAEWSIRMTIAITALGQQLDKANEIIPPSQLEEIDTHLREAVRYFKSTPEKLLNALETVDLDTLVDITEDVKLGNEQIGLFRKAINGL